MPHRIDPSRRCLPVSEWPDIDQTLWRQATSPISLLDESRSSASAWSPATTHKHRRGYGRWLNFLFHEGDELSTHPIGRVKNASVNRYLVTLRAQGVAPYTQFSRMAELLSVMLAIVPNRDWSWLKRKVNFLSRLAEESHQTKVPPFLAPQIATRAREALDGLMQSKRKLRIHEGVAYRNWLMVLFLVLIPLRLKNFTVLSIGKELHKSNETWEVRISGRDTKTGRSIRAPIPSSLSTHLEFYRDSVRPLLLRGRQADRLWVTWVGRDMSEHAVYMVVTQFTAAQFGHRINPHAFRHIAATSISLLKPEEIDTARALLGHSSCKTTLHHYVAANSVIAGRRHALIINRLRKRLPGPSSRGKASESELLPS